jgi:hypothetical protein
MAAIANPPSRSQRLWRNGCRADEGLAAGCELAAGDSSLRTGLRWVEASPRFTCGRWSLDWLQAVLTERREVDQEVDGVGQPAGQCCL